MPGGPADSPIARVNSDRSKVRSLVYSDGDDEEAESGAIR